MDQESRNVAHFAGGDVGEGIPERLFTEMASEIKVEGDELMFGLQTGASQKEVERVASDPGARLDDGLCVQNDFHGREASAISALGHGRSDLSVGDGSRYFSY